MDQLKSNSHLDHAHQAKRKRAHNGRSFLQGGKLRFAAFLYWYLWAHLLFIFAAVYLFYISSVPDPRLGKLIIYAIFAFVGVYLFYLHTKSQLQCPLCFGPLLKDNSCRKHRKAERYMFMTYSASQSLKVILTGKFRCMYCGELFKNSKERSRDSRRHASTTHHPSHSSPSDPPQI